MASSYGSIFGEHLVDMMWSVDAELDEILSDATNALSGNDKGTLSNSNATPLLAEARNAKQNVERDKDTIRLVVKKLLVRGVVSVPPLSLTTWIQDCGIVNPSFCRERLDSAVLASVGLISDKTSLDKKEIRTRTGLLCVPDPRHIML
jgi:THO complex subunit 2